MRDKYHKASKDLKDLKETNVKMEQFDKRKTSRTKECIRKVKSSKYLRMTSES